MNELKKEKLFRKLTEENIPATVLIEITRNCNYKCEFCYINGGDKIEIDYEVLINTLKDIRKMGGMRVIFTGGEPLLYSQAERLFYETKKMGFLCEINTNGSLISSKYIKMLADLFTSVNISLHSFVPYEHDMIIGKEGEWEKVVNNIHKLVEANANVTVNTVITNKLQNKVNEMKEFVEESLKCKWNPDTKIVPNYNGDIIGKEKWSIKDDYISEVTNITESYLIKEKSVISNGICSAAKKTCFIDANGNVYPCLQFKNYESRIYKFNVPLNIYENDFHTIWNENSFFDIIRNLHADDFLKCKHCFWYQKCFKCIAENIAETGEFTLPSQEICEREKIRLKLGAEKNEIEL